jgi:hypothetical protein
MKINLDQLENRLQALIEVRLVKMLPGRKVEDLIAQQLANALRSNLAPGENGSQLAPTIYTLVMSPDSAKHWQADPQLLETLKETLNLAGKEAGLYFASPVTLSIASDPELAPDEVRVVASHKVEPISETKGVQVAAEELPEASPKTLS